MRCLQGDCCGHSLDVIEIDAASNRGIDQIRELREMVRYAPAAARYKDRHSRRSPYAHRRGIERSVENA